MIVAAHGNVDKFCEERGMTIGEHYVGAVEEYDGDYLVIVTSEILDKKEYYYLKYKMLRRKKELVSIHHDDKEFSGFIVYLNARETEVQKMSKVRLSYGFYREGGEIRISDEHLEIARQVIELRDSGLSYAKIQQETSLSVGVIRGIIENRNKYEGGGTHK